VVTFTVERAAKTGIVVVVSDAGFIMQETVMDSLTLSDEQLVEQYNQGSLLCFDEVLTRYESKLFYFLKTLVGGEREAEESLQELAVLAFTRLGESLTTTSDVSPKEGAVKRWLFAQAISIAQFKIAQQRRDISIEKVRLHEDLGDDVMTLRQAVETALAELPLEYRLAFLLWDVAGFTLPDIVLLTNGNPFEARMRINRARLGIRKLSLKRRQPELALGAIRREIQAGTVTIN